MANCDAAAQAFENELPTFLQMVNTSLTEGMKYVAASTTPLDPQRLYFTTAYARESTSSWTAAGTRMPWA